MNRKRTERRTWRAIAAAILVAAMVLVPCQSVFAMEEEATDTAMQEAAEAAEIEETVPEDETVPVDQPEAETDAPAPGDGEQDEQPDAEEDAEDPEVSADVSEQSVEEAQAETADAPAAAAAAAAINFDQLAERIAAAEDGGTVAVSGNIALSEALEIDKSLKFAAPDGVTATLTVDDAHRHLLVTGGTVSLGFSGVVLDGGGEAGGIRSEADHLILQDVVIKNCRATDGKAGVQQTLGGAVNALGAVTIEGKTKITGSRAGTGGGVYASFVTLESGEVSGNTATNSGGGIAAAGEIDELSLVINGGKIANNTARDNGGAYGRVVEMNGGEITGNRAETAGGLAAYDELIMTGGSITGNTAYGLGTYAGGVHASKAMTMTGGEISNNVAADRGGAVYTRFGAILIDGGVITGNTAENGGGICTYDLGALHIRGNSVVADNQADQAYYINDEADIALHNAQIDSSATWTQGFDYIYNNHDVMYTKGTTEPVVPQFTVKVVTRYLDGALPENTETYLVDAGAAFEEPFEVLEGYDLYGMQTLSMPVFHADMNTKLVSISEVNQDYTIVLEFDKYLYKVQVVTRYLDNALPENTDVYWVRHGDAFSAPFEVLEGYDLYGMQTLSMPVINADMNTKTVSISEVKQDYTIVLEFDKAIYNVKIVVRYEDGSKEDVVDIYQVKHGDPFETTFEFEPGYSIRNISMNAVGVAVDRNTRTVKIARVVSPVEVVITLR